MRKEIVTYKTPGPFLINVKLNHNLVCLKIVAMQHISTLHTLRRAAAALQMYGATERSICVDARP